LSPEERQALRQEKSAPILDELYQWLVETQPSVVPKSALGKAVNYLLNQWPKLHTYLEDGRLSIDNDGSKKLDVLPIGGRRDGERESVQLGDDLSSQRSQSVLLLRASIPRAAQTDIE
jgi:transposase